MQTKRRSKLVLLSAAMLIGLGATAARAQEKLEVQPQVAEPAAEAVAAAPRALTLDEALALGFERQAALSAARSSLDSAQIGYRSLNNLPFYAKLLSRDLPIRKQQACLGITIAQASLQQAEWETRYAVTRNFYSVQYARLQLELLDQLVGKLEKGRATAKRVLDAGEITKVTKIDLDNFAVNIDLLRVKQIEGRIGLQRAKAALREAIGVGPEFPLEVAPSDFPEVVKSFDKDVLIAQALANRGEVIQAGSAYSVTELEVLAQGKKMFGLTQKTFAAGSDIHARPIPQGVSNGEYRPGAIGLEMPVFLVGKRPDRMDRAAALSSRAAAVVDKTQNLVALETESTYLKWLEAKEKLDLLNDVRPKAVELQNTIEKRLQDGNASGDEYIRATTLLDQIRAQTNENLYLHALSLAALERVTAGGFRLPTASTATAAEPAESDDSADTKK